MQSLIGAIGSAMARAGLDATADDPMINRTLQVGAFRVKVVGTIAAGGFAVVYRVKDLGPAGTVYALKYMNVGQDDAYKQARIETVLLEKLRGHPNVVTLVDKHVPDRVAPGAAVMLLLEACEANLVDVLQKHAASARGVGLPEQHVLAVFGAAAGAVAAMHALSPPVAHRDVKAENLLLARDGSWRLCDFGSASTVARVYGGPAEMAAMEDEVRRCTTPACRPPEMWDLYRREVVNHRCDLWALGCLLFRLAYLKPPFDGESKLAVLNRAYRQPTGVAYSPGLKQLITDLLSSPPEARPDAATVCERAAALYHAAGAAGGAVEGPSLAGGSATGNSPGRVGVESTADGARSLADAVAAAAARAGRGTAVVPPSPPPAQAQPPQASAPPPAPPPPVHAPSSSSPLAPATTRDDDGAPPSSAPWVCSVCTLQNRASYLACEACGTAHTAAGTVAHGTNPAFHGGGNWDPPSVPSPREYNPGWVDGPLRQAIPVGPPVGGVRPMAQMAQMASRGPPPPPPPPPSDDPVSARPRPRPPATGGHPEPEAGMQAAALVAENNVLRAKLRAAEAERDSLAAQLEQAHLQMQQLQQQQQQQLRPGGAPGGGGLDALFELQVPELTR